VRTPSRVHALLGVSFVRDSRPEIRLQPDLTKILTRNSIFSNDEDNLNQHDKSTGFEHNQRKLKPTIKFSLHQQTCDKASYAKDNCDSQSNTVIMSKWTSQLQEENGKGQNHSKHANQSENG
jgi:hypothetical protein